MWHRQSVCAGMREVYLNMTFSTSLRVALLDLSVRVRGLMAAWAISLLATCLHVRIGGTPLKTHHQIPRCHAWLHESL